MDKLGGGIIGVCTMMLVQIVDKELQLGLGVWSRIAICCLLDSIIITAAFMGRD